MSGAPPAPMSGSREPATNAPPDDPLAADKRTMIVALIAMVVLVSVGVVSAAVFTGSACRDISSSSAAPAAARADVTAGLEAAFPSAGAERLAVIDTQLAGLAERLGPITGVAVVDGADGLATAADGLAAVGPVTSLLDAAGAEAVARAEVGTGVVVGDGDALISLARVNDLTGQVDAFATLDATATGGLAEIGCVDTATVGTPLAFELDAADGQLLLFRAGEDGEDAELELRDPRDGRRWSSRVDVGVAPPGVTGERIDARLGDRLAVLVRRTEPGEDVPLVTAVDRADGTRRWDVGRDGFAGLEVGATTSGSEATTGSDAVATVLRGDVAQRLELVALDEEQVLIAVTDVRDAAAVAAGGTDALGPSVGPGALVALDADDGAVRWTSPLGVGVRVLAGSSNDAGTWLVFDDDGRHQLVGIDGAGQRLGAASDDVLAEVAAMTTSAESSGGGRGPAGPSAAVAVAPPDLGDGLPTAIAVLGDALVLVTVDDGQVIAEVEGPRADEANASLRAHDVVLTADRVHVLFAGPDASVTEQRMVVVTFGIG